MNIGDKLTLNLRKTFRFRDGWSHLDKFEELGELVILDVLVGKDEACEDPCERPRVVLFVEITPAPPEIDRSQIEEALYSSLGGSSCTHEHDCCGCVAVSVEDVFFSDRDCADEGKLRAWVCLSRYANY